MRPRSHGRAITRWVLGLTLLLGLAVALGGAWAWRASGLELLDWGYPRLALGELHMDRLSLARTLPAGDQIRFDARDLRLTWAGLGNGKPRLEMLDIAQLKVDWRAGPADPDPASAAPTDFQPLLANLVWLTRVTHIQGVQLDLPCPTGACRWEAGPLRLESEVVPAERGNTWKGRLLAQLPRMTVAGVEFSDLSADVLFLGNLDAGDGVTLGPVLAMRGLVELSAGSVGHSSLHPQAWTLGGDLDANLDQLAFQGELSAASGFAAPLTLSWDAQAGLVAQVPGADLAFATGNPLTAVLIDWPALLSLDGGAARITLKLTAPVAKPWRGDLTLDLDGLSGIHDRIAFTGLTGHLTGVVTARELRLDLPRLSLPEANVGLTLGPLSLACQYQAPLEAPGAGTLSWRQAEAGLFGGRVWLEPGSLTVGKSHPTLPVRFEGVELASLLAAYPTEGLSGAGTLEGRLPVRLGAEGISIQEGTIFARAPGGQLQFRSEGLRAYGAANPALQLVVQALDDFQFDQLDSDLSYDEDGKLLLALHLSGRNPAIEGGRLINFNIKLEENIPALLTSLQLSDRVSETIRERVRERVEGKAGKQGKGKTGAFPSRINSSPMLTLP